MTNEQTGNEYQTSVDEEGMTRSYQETTKDDHIIYAGIDNDDESYAKLTSPTGELLLETLGHSCLDDALVDLEESMYYQGLSRCADGTARWYYSILGI